MMQSHRIFVVWSVAIALLTNIGCSAKSSIIIARPLNVRIRDYQSIAVEIDKWGLGNDHENSCLHKRIVVRLIGSGLFNKVCREKEELSQCKLLLKVVVTDIRRISPGQRLVSWTRARMKARAELVDRETGEILGSCMAVGLSSLEWSSGFTDHAVEQSAEQIAKFVINGYLSRE